MLSVTPPPPLFSTNGWPFEEPISHNSNDNTGYGESLFDNHSLFPIISSSQTKVEEAETYSTPSQSQGTSSNLTMVKKLVHNASERDRRKKINTLYSSLRSLLPVADQMKKLSIPATVSRVLKYIPELQHQVEGLTKKKEEILLRISRKSDAIISKESQRNNQPRYNSGVTVSTTMLDDTEAAIQISCYSVHKKILLSEILLCLENEGFVMFTVSSSENFGGRVFYNFHFQVDKAMRLEPEILNEKVLSMIEKEENFV